MPLFFEPRLEFEIELVGGGILLRSPTMRRSKQLLTNAAPHLQYPASYHRRAKSLKESDFRTGPEEW
ncbi:unnamed protein product [Gemmata massiliana]|uniref:Uncharacterized protein n=1 Tax=Gemmata massiliana TaxID=1210884 RepID=A0A6P2CWW2_9BACT|nr:unnamed protein product [Gemmata massiliana]